MGISKAQFFRFALQVEEKEGIPPPQQRLIFAGKQMNDEKTAADYKVRQIHYLLCYIFNLT